ncbi:MAG: DUF4175 family protein, partial [Myxococcota bacterium]
MTEAQTDPANAVESGDAPTPPPTASTAPPKASSTETEAKPGQHYQQIQSAVLGVQRLILGRLRWEGCLYAAAVLVAFLWVGAVLFAFVPAYGWLRLVFGLFWLGTTLSMVWWRTLRPSQQFQSVHDVGRWIEEHVSGFRNDITASLQFGRDLDDIRRNGQMSVALIERVLQTTHDKVQTQANDILQAAPEARVQLPWAIIGTAVVGFVLGSLIAPATFSQGLGALFLGHQPSAKVGAVQEQVVQRTAIVADLTLRYNFPAYSGLPARRLLNTTGDIEVLRGTEVTFEATAIRPVRRAELVLKTDAFTAEGDSTPRDERILLERRPGGRLVARFSVMDSGSYTLVATLEDGTEVEDGIQRSLVALPDENPSLTIFQPEAEIDVAPGDAVTFVFEASDDFGLTELSMVTALNGSEDDKQRTLIKTLDGSAPAVIPGDSRPVNAQNETTRSLKLEHMLDLVPFNLRAKDQLVVWLEAADNDTVSGPKVAASEPILLRVASPEDKHLQIIAEQEEIVESLILNLADFLEAPIDDLITTAQGNRRRAIPPDWDIS